MISLAFHVVLSSVFESDCSFNSQIQRNYGNMSEQGKSRYFLSPQSFCVSHSRIAELHRPDLDVFRNRPIEIFHGSMHVCGQNFVAFLLYLPTNMAMANHEIEYSSVTSRKNKSFTIFGENRSNIS